MLTVTQRVLAAEGGNGWGNLPPIIPHPGELIVGLLCFAVVYWVYKSKVVPPLEKVYRDRVDAIEGGLARAEQAQSEAEATKAEFQQKLADARTEASEIREQARAEASAIASQIRKKAAEDASRITEGASRQVESERQQAMVALRRDVGGLATTLAGRIVGQEMRDPAAQAGVIDRFLMELESKDPVSTLSNESALDAYQSRSSTEGQ